MNVQTEAKLVFPQERGSSSNQAEFICMCIDKNYLALLSVTYTFHSCKIVPTDSASDGGGKVCYRQCLVFHWNTNFPLPGILENLPGTTWKGSCLVVIDFAAAFLSLSGSISTVVKLLFPCRTHLLKNTSVGYRFIFLNTLNNFAAPSSKWPLVHQSYNCAHAAASEWHHLCEKEEAELTQSTARAQGNVLTSQNYSIPPILQAPKTRRGW